MRNRREKPRKRAHLTARGSRLVRLKTMFYEFATADAVLALLAVGFGIGLIGPFGTFLSEPAWLRIPYFMASMLISYGLWAALEKCISRFAPELSQGIQLVLVAAPFSIINSALLVIAHSLLDMWRAETLLLTWVLFFATHMILSLLSIIPAILLVRRISSRMKLDACDSVVDFLSHKLSPKIRNSELLAVQAEDHYIRVYTARGSDLISMSFGDAMIALQGYQGSKVHRSWWVALDAIEHVQPDGTSLLLKLKDGLSVPVSRRLKSEFKRKLKAFHQTPSHGA